MRVSERQVERIFSAFDETMTSIQRAADAGMIRPPPRVSILDLGTKINALFGIPGLRPIDRLILIWIVSSPQCPKPTKEGWLIGWRQPMLDALACEPRTLRHSLDRLADQGWIEVERRMRHDGANLATAIRLGESLKPLS